MTDNIVLLASYPKTGSTWMRKLIAEMLVVDGDGFEIIPSFFKVFPEISPQFMLRGSVCRLIKTHLHPEHETFGLFQGSLKAILSIRRHPLDILLSSLNYACMKENAASFIGGRVKSVESIIADGEFRHYIDQFLDTDGFPFYSGQCGAFSAYQRRWRAAGEITPYLEICYEDMVADPAAAARSILTFLGLQLSDIQIRKVLKNVAWRTRQNGKFFWRRRAYNYEELLPGELSSDFNVRYKPVLDELGYGSRTPGE